MERSCVDQEKVMACANERKGASVSTSQRFCSHLVMIWVVWVSCVKSSCLSGVLIEEGFKCCDGGGFLCHVQGNSVCGCALTLVLHTDCGIVLNPDENLLLEGDLGIYLTRHVAYYFYMVYWFFFYIVSWVFEEATDNYNLILLLLTVEETV